MEFEAGNKFVIELIPDTRTPWTAFFLTFSVRPKINDILDSIVWIGKILANFKQGGSNSFPRVTHAEILLDGGIFCLSVL